jgi:hypothetical protein
VNVVNGKQESARPTVGISVVLEIRTARRAPRGSARVGQYKPRRPALPPLAAGL